MKNSFHFFTSFALNLSLCLSLVFLPLAPRAQAGQRDRDYQSVCVNQPTGWTGAATCTSALNSLETKDVETAQLVLYTTATAATIVAAVFENSPVPATAAAAKTFCAKEAFAVPAAAMVTEATAEWILNDGNKAKETLIQKGGPLLAAFGVQKLSGGAVTKALGGASVKAFGKKVNLSCAIVAAGFGILAYTSENSVKAADKAFDDSIATAKGMVTIAGTNTATGLGVNLGKSGTNSNRSADASSGSATTPVCDLACLGTKSPEIAAMTANQPFADQMSKALGGQNLGDYANGFQGSTPQDAQNYAANALGVDPATVADLMNGTKQALAESGIFDKYKPVSYASNTSAGGKVSDSDPDFAKMMADMMKKLNPDATKDEKKDPSELVFRQLDLLPAEKIVQNKDISLFARVGFRYRKNLSNVEQLNPSQNH